MPHEEVLSLQPIVFPPSLNVLTLFPMTWGCSESLDAFRFFLTGPHAFGPKYLNIGHKILLKQPHDCSY